MMGIFSVKFSYFIGSIIFVISLCVPLFNTLANCDTIDCDSTIVWGPGLDPVKLILPVRYFFIESLNKNKSSLGQSLKKDTFDVTIIGENKKSCKIWTDVLNRKDGSFIVRYKVHSICDNPTISVKCRGKDIPNFPLNLRGTIYPDECLCHTPLDIDTWLSVHSCPQNYDRINKDLEPFTTIDIEMMQQAARETLFKDPYKCSVCNYVIKNNSVYRTCYGQHTGFKMFMDATLLSVTRKVRLPDMEILVNLGDWPLIKQKTDLGDKKVLIPVLSWCGSKETWDIVMPTYDITESTLESMVRVTLDMLSVQGNIEKTWESKVPKLFWRGRDSNRERLLLIKIGRDYPNLINASLTNFFFFRELEKEYGPIEKRVSFFEFFNYKYQMNMDGTVAAYRFPYLLAGDSLVFKQESSYYEHFYTDLKPWTHYVPVMRDLSNLIERIQWAIEHNDEAHHIAREGQRYARENLLPKDIFCYYISLFLEYSKRLKNETISVRPNMERVDQKNYPECRCNTTINRDEL